MVLRRLTAAEASPVLHFSLIGPLTGFVAASLLATPPHTRPKHVPSPSHLFPHAERPTVLGEAHRDSFIDLPSPKPGVSSN